MTLAVHTVLIDDARVRVNRFDFGPGDDTGPHVHALPYVIVPLTDGRLRVVGDDGSEVFSDLTASIPYSREAGASHNVFNASDAALSFLEIEVKA